MKAKVFVHTFVLICLLSPFLVCGEDTVLVKASNPSRFPRRNEMISLRWSDLRKEYPSFEPANILVIDGKTNTELPTQSNPDELLFLADFEESESRSFSITQRAREHADGRSLVDGRFVEPRQDYAWENDRIAFRMYGPALAAEVSNGIDVWTKRVRYLIVEKWYKGEEEAGNAKISYHTDHGEGADFFSVGKSLGAGGSGIWLSDRVYQPGVFSSQRTICNGPLRITFELTYDKWHVGGRQLTETRRISLDAGQNLNKIEVTFSGLNPDDTLLVSCGLAKRKGTVFISGGKNNPWISLWGQTNTDSVNGSLGTGIILVDSTFVGLNEDKDQHLIIARAKAGKVFTYYTGAGWTGSGDFASADDWNTYLEGYAQRLRDPLKITLTRRK